MINEEIQVLDHGFVRLDSAMADDLSVVNSARVSFAQRSELEWAETDENGEKLWRAEQVLKEADKKLIGFLMRNRHGTPFEHNALRFHIKAPLVVIREWQRHRIGSFNELSGRYKEFENPDFYIPKYWRTQVGKPGAYSFDQWKGNTKMASELMLRHFQDSYDLYKWYVNGGVAKEQARGVLPLYLYSEMYWTVNARSLMNFLGLRNSDQAMWEIREYAQVVEELWAEQMPTTAEAFVNNNRVAP